MSLSIELESKTLDLDDHVSQKIKQVANQPGEFAHQIRQWRFLQRLSNPVLVHLQETTGFPFWLADKVETCRRYIQGEIDISREPYNPCTCGHTGITLLSQEIFSQKYIKTIKSFPNFLQELQDDQPGVFQVISHYFDHTFILIKTIENGMPKYRVVQSFVGVYSLKFFIETSGKEFFYEDYQDLEHRFLKPLEQVISAQNPIGLKELTMLAKLSYISDITVWIRWAKNNNKFERVIPDDFRALNLKRTTDSKQEAYTDSPIYYLDGHFDSTVTKTLDVVITMATNLGIGILTGSAVSKL